LVSSGSCPPARASATAAGRQLPLLTNVDEWAFTRC